MAIAQVSPSASSAVAPAGAGSTEARSSGCREHGRGVQRLQVNERLLSSVIDGTVAGLEMTRLAPIPIGATRFFTATRHYSVIVGYSGESSGTMAINMGERTLLLLAGRLLDEALETCGEAACDAAMELGNMIAGAIKERLQGSEYRLDYLSLPSLVQGASYTLYHARGIHTITVIFELPEIPAAFHEDRFFSVTLALLRAAGG